MNRNNILTLSVFVILIGSLFPLSIPLNAEEQNDYDATLSFTYSFHRPVLQSIQLLNKTFTKINLPDLSSSNLLGKPVVPQKLLRILLPKDHEVKDIQITPINTGILRDGRLSLIKHGSISQRFSITETTEQMKDTINYEKNSYYPSDQVNQIGLQYKHGFPILYLIVYPVQYLHSEQQIRYATQMKLTIETTKTNEAGFTPMMQYASEITSCVENPEEMQSYQKDSSSTLTDSSLPPYEYVIITSEALKNNNGSYPYTLQDLINHRIDQGLSCLIKTVEEITMEYDGVDDQEKIRNFIRDAYDNHQTKWVLLAGDVEQVPIRYLYDVDGAEKDINQLYEDRLPSDVYYQCLDGTYNYDGDEFWGEEFDGVNGDRIDLSAEIYLGRAPVDDAGDVSAFVEKTITFEAADWDDDAYIRKVLSAGEEVWSGPGGYGAGYVERCIDFCSDYDMETYGIPSDQYQIHEFYERDMVWVDDDIISVIDQGVSLINHVGHGTSVSAMKLSSIELEDLNNAGKYGLFYTQACHAGQLDRHDECFAEKWVNIEQKGGFAAIMNTGFGYGSNQDYDSADNRIAREFFDALFSPYEQISRIGEAQQDSKEDNIWHIDDENMFHGFYATMLFGDPYVSIPGAEEAGADFSWTPQYPRTGEMISFTDNSEGMITYRKWEFGDGMTSNEEDPVHVFASENTYEVSLTVMDQQGYVSTKTIPVEVKDEWYPIPLISPSSYNGVNFTVPFSAADSWDPDGEIVSYQWNFDDGSTSSLMNPVHTFAEEGTYTVALDIEDDDGNTARAYSTIVLSYQAPPMTPSTPTGDTTAFSGSIAQFSVSTTDPEGDQVQYAWDWDDGSSVEWTDWYASGELCQIDHEFHSLGAHQIRVKARDQNYGESNWSESLLVMVSDEHAPDLVIKAPRDGLYLSNEKRVSLPFTLVFGSVDILVNASDMSGIEKVLFYIDDMHRPVAEVLSEPFVFSWNERAFGRALVKIEVIDNAGKLSSEQLRVWKFF